MIKTEEIIVKEMKKIEKKIKARNFDQKNL